MRRCVILLAVALLSASAAVAADKPVALYVQLPPDAPRELINDLSKAFDELNLDQVDITRRLPAEYSLEQLRAMLWREFRNGLRMQAKFSAATETMNAKCKCALEPELRHEVVYHMLDATIFNRQYGPYGDLTVIQCEAVDEDKIRLRIQTTDAKVGLDSELNYTIGPSKYKQSAVDLHLAEPAPKHGSVVNAIFGGDGRAYLRLRNSCVIAPNQILYLTYSIAGRDTDCGSSLSNKTEGNH